MSTSVTDVKHAKKHRTIPSMFTQDMLSHQLSDKQNTPHIYAYLHRKHLNAFLLFEVALLLGADSAATAHVLLEKDLARMWELCPFRQ